MSSADRTRDFDANADGTLSRDEHVEGSRSMFDKVGADPDGGITAASRRRNGRLATTG